MCKQEEEEEEEEEDLGKVKARLHYDWSNLAHKP